MAYSPGSLNNPHGATSNGGPAQGSSTLQTTELVGSQEMITTVMTAEPFPDIYINGGSANVYTRQDVFDLDRLITLASIDFDPHVYDLFKDFFEAKIFEHKLDRATLQTIFDKTNTPLLDEALDTLEDELEIARTKLAAARYLYDIIRNTELSFVDPEKTRGVQSAYDELLKKRTEPDLLAIGDEEQHDLFQHLHEITQFKHSKLRSMPPTFLYAQVIQDLKQYFHEGGGPAIHLHPFQAAFGRTYNPKKDPGKLSQLYDAYTSQLGRKALFQVGISKTNQGRDYVYSSRWNKRIPNKEQDVIINRVAQICSMLATEFRLSAGLGRVHGTALANKYGVSASKTFPLIDLFGGPHVRNMMQTGKKEGSLQDLAIVGLDGKTKYNPQTTTGVSLFDAYVADKNSTYTDVRSGFLETLRDEPENNLIGNLDKIIQRAESTFNDADILMNDVLLEGEDLNLLSGHGLFIRVLEEFCKLINYQGFEGDEVARAEQITGMHLLGLAGQSSDINGWSAILKQRLNIFIARLMMRRRQAAGVVIDRQVRMSALEQSATFKANIEEVATDRRILAEAVMVYARFTGLQGMKGISVNSHTRIITNANKFKSSFQTASGPNSLKNKTGLNKCALLSGEDILDVNKDADGSEGFLRSICDVFEELESEAMDMAGESAYINKQRLTNHAGLDGALVTALLLECFCLLQQAFGRTELILGAQLDGNTVNTSDEEGDGLTDLTFGQFADYVATLQDSKETAAANNHIFGGSTSDEFVDFFMNTTSGQLLSSAYTNAKNIYNQEDYGAKDYLGGEGKGTGATDTEIANSMMDQLSFVKELANAGGYHGNGFDMTDKIIKNHNSPRSFAKHVLTRLRNRAASQFSTARHALLYEDGNGDGRTVLLEVLNAAKEGSFDMLFSPDGDFIAADGLLPVGVTTAKYDDTFTSDLVMNTINRLALNHVLPTRSLTACRAMFKYLKDSTQEISTVAAALRTAGNADIVHRGTTITDPDEQLQSIVRLRNSIHGRELLRKFSKRQLEIIESRLATLENADENQAYIPKFLEESTIQALRILIDDMQNSPKGKIVFYGLPAGKLEDLIFNKNAEKIDEEGYDSTNFSNFISDDFADAEMVFRFSAVDELRPLLKLKEEEITFPLAVTVDEAGIAAAFQQEIVPQTFQELVRSTEFTLDSPLTTEVTKTFGRDLSIKYEIRGLKNVVRSFLLKRLAEIVYAIDVTEDELINIEPAIFKGQQEFLVRDKNSTRRNLMKALAETIGLPNTGVLGLQSPVDALFGVNSGNSTAAANRLNPPTKKSQTKFALNIAAMILNGNAGAEIPLSLQKQIPQIRDLLIKLFDTAPFFADSIQEFVMRPSLFDYVFGVFVDGFEIDIGASNTASDKAKKTAEEEAIQSAQTGPSLRTAYCKAFLRNRKTGISLE